MRGGKMSAYTLNIPDDLMREAEQLAKVNNASVNDILLTAIADLQGCRKWRCCKEHSPAERMGAERVQKIFSAFAKRADMEAVQRILDRVPDVAPVPGDEI